MRAISGNRRIQMNTTAIAPMPPISTAGTAPSHAAISPARNSPSEPDEPVNIEFTVMTRPSISVGVRVCTMEWRMTTLMASEAP